MTIPTLTAVPAGAACSAARAQPVGGEVRGLQPLLGQQHDELRRPVAVEHVAGADLLRERRADAADAVVARPASRPIIATQYACP